jgi:hypothetical protein
MVRRGFMCYSTSNKRSKFLCFKPASARILVMIILIIVPEKTSFKIQFCPITVLQVAQSTAITSSYGQISLPPQLQHHSGRAFVPDLATSTVKQW